VTKRYALRDDQWSRIKNLLPGREGTVGVTAKDNRLFIEAVLYRYRAVNFLGSIYLASSVVWLN
jgi:transposase